MEYSVSLSLIDGVTFAELPGEMLAVETPQHAFRPRLVLTGVTPGLRTALESLQGGATLPEMLGTALKTDGTNGAAKLSRYVRKMEQFALLGRTLLGEDLSPVASLRPLSAHFQFDEMGVDETQDFVLSRFACVRSVQGTMTLECPLGYAEIQLHGPTAQLLLHALARPIRLERLAAFAKVPMPVAAEFVKFLRNAGAAVHSLDGSVEPDSTDPALAQWEFHDLLFHSRCRMGRHGNPFGGTFPFKDKFAPLPVIKLAMSPDKIPLAKPDLDKLKRDEATFTTVLEARTSIREQGEPPISLTQLGEFLYRTARVKKIAEAGGVSFRPHPAGGALHELEIYPVVDRCEGLPPGLYHYNPLEHCLYKVSDTNPKVNTLLRMAGATAMMEGAPQLLLILGARFQRIQMKYQSVSYSVILKNVGALYQTMYLVATAMGLAPSALGGGHSDLFAQAAGLNYLEETSVGEFVLGTRAAGAGGL